MGKKEKLSAGFSMPKTEPERTAVTEAAAERFVKGSKSPTRAKAARARPSSSKPSEKPSGERLTVYLPPKLAEALRVHCAKNRQSLSDASAAALTMWLKSSAHK